MAALILLNGPPASGKSTLARIYAGRHQLALSLDIDVVRGLLGDWLAAPVEAGLAARSLALSMAETHLLSGHNVIVPQFLGRPEFAEELEALAARLEVTFVEVALMMDRDEAVAAFAERSAESESQAHRDAVELIEQSIHPDPVGNMYDAFVEMISGRPSARLVDVVRGDVEGTFSRFLTAVKRADGSEVEERPTPLLRRLPR